jgi:hypothetical protein
MDFSSAATLAVGGGLLLVLLFGATAVVTRDPGRRTTAMAVFRLLLMHNALPWSRRGPQDQDEDADQGRDEDQNDVGGAPGPVKITEEKLQEGGGAAQPERPR